MLACGAGMRNMSSGQFALLLAFLASWGITYLLTVINPILIWRLNAGKKFKLWNLGFYGLNLVFGGYLFLSLWRVIPNPPAITPEWLQELFGRFLIFGIPVMAISHFVFLFSTWLKLRVPRRKPEASLENYSGPRCVSCREPIELGVSFCPKCGWTQPA